MSRLELLIICEATSKPFLTQLSNADVYSPRSLKMSLKKKDQEKAATVMGENTDQATTPMFWLCKAQNYKKIYFYIQQTILCKHVKYVSFRKHGHIINTGNIGIHKRQKKNPGQFKCNAAHIWSNWRGEHKQTKPNHPNRITGFSVSECKTYLVIVLLIVWLCSRKRKCAFHILGGKKYIRFYLISLYHVNIYSNGIT